MRIVLTGGGSGGHITPLLAVAHELKQLEPNSEIVCIGQRGDSLSDVPATDPSIAAVYTVRAGKYRRYSGQKLLKRLLDLPTLAKNVRDGGRAVRGLAESRKLLKKLKPDVVFIKGGFVGVPVGLAAAQLGIPFVTHDSDAIPGLANRIIARWATFHAVALPKENYRYPLSKTMTVGVPISRHFKPVNADTQQQYKNELGLDKFEQVIFVTGGGNGAKQLNTVVVNSASQLLEQYPKLAIIHLSGRALEVETKTAYDSVLPPALRPNVIVKGFVTDLYRYSGAADVIIGRGSATNLAEFAMQAKACIIIPAKQLAWTVENTKALSLAKAAIELDEDQLLNNPNVLTDTCVRLLGDSKQRQNLGQNLHRELAHTNSAGELAKLILKAAKK